LWETVWKDWMNKPESELRAIEEKELKEAMEVWKRLMTEKERLWRDLDSVVSRLISHGVLMKDAVEKMEEEYIRRTIEKCKNQGDKATQHHIAKLLGIDPGTLKKKACDYGLADLLEKGRNTKKKSQ